MAEKEPKPEKTEKKTLPYKSISETQMAAVDGVLNPSQDRMAEFSNIKPSMTFGIAMSIVRERAADPMRNRISEPLSMVWRSSLFKLWRGEGFKTAMLAGNVALGLKTDGDSDIMPARNKTIF